MSESLGEKLKQAREEREITISEVAEQTRISALYLEAIENDDYRTLPGGIFNKGFVKSFAKYVGVDEHEALQDYTHIISNQQPDNEEPEFNNYRPEVLTDDSSGSMLPTIIFAVIILGLMTWGILALVNYLQNSESSVAPANIADNNVKDNTNSNANANNVNGKTSDNQAIPSIDEIKVKITSTAPELSITATTDGKLETRMLNSEITEQTFEAEEKLKLRYYKGSAETVQLTINGKKIETPLPPPGYKGNGFEYEINLDNIEQILRSGKFSFGNPNNANSNRQTNTGANSNTKTNAPTQ